MNRFLIEGLGVIAVASAIFSPSAAAATSHLGGPAQKIAAPQSAAVHVSLRAAAAVSANADGFFTLGSIADITGGAAAARARLSAVTVGRAPMFDSERHLTPDDIALKLRQAGLNPNRDAVIDGAAQITVTLAAAAAAPLPAAFAPPKLHSSPASSPANPAAAPAIAVKRGDDVSIVIEEDGLSIATSGVARDPGAVGDTIRVHRTGSPTDLSAVVLDARTVQLEL